MNKNLSDEKEICVEEKLINAKNGWVVLFLNIFLMLACIPLGIMGIIYGMPLLTVVSGIYLCIIGPIMFGGLKIIKPKEALVLTLFGKYVGTLKKDGFYFVNPFCTSVNPLAISVFPGAPAAALQQSSKINENSGTNATFNKKISLKAMTLENKKQKVNDELGNPIEIEIVVIWRIQNTAKAVFNVDNYSTFLSIQADSALRDVARLYPYDIFEEEENDKNSNEKTLRGSSQEVADKLKEELQKCVDIAGLEIMAARITHLAYAPEIAAAMLQRQQASAIIAARQKIVEGAVGMVEMAINKLNEKSVCNLDEERKAAMVSNLLVVLCGNKDAQPIVNSGSIY